MKNVKYWVKVLFRVSSVVGMVMLAILLERGMFYEQLMYDIIIDRTTFKWNIHVRRHKGSMNFL